MTIDKLHYIHWCKSEQKTTRNYHYKIHCACILDCYFLCSVYFSAISSEFSPMTWWIYASVFVVDKLTYEKKFGILKLLIYQKCSLCKTSHFLAFSLLLARDERYFHTEDFLFSHCLAECPKMAEGTEGVRTTPPPDIQFDIIEIATIFWRRFKGSKQTKGGL
jgi:hypothetical protein